MPELPEVETIRTALDQVLTGRVIVKVEIFSPAMRTSLKPLLDAKLEGRTICAIRRRGRYLALDLNPAGTLVMHLGMSGVVRVEPLSVPRRKHEHVFMHLDDGMVFRFECARRFSILEYALPPAAGADLAHFAKLGVEPLSEAFNAQMFYRKIHKSHAPVKVLLMDNSIVTGIGNIYAAETLFASGVRPSRKGCRVTQKEAAAIVESAKRVLRRAIAAGGSTIHSYRHVDGSEGKFAQELAIYGREGESCPVCAAKIRKVELGGRSSCYCPHCQK
ncbi:MAG: bifunctional DNA-formamidopyrimidine glycosylase/DNA-(apurinic or apyrimidinic site) lyase [Victivallaceae bacterium]|nr:bifunctional DNA-formamidopyrimidine glycosylase/DNA-(apurinic or apyrimidinic site) lyase [Victivallaceae bacterium]